MFNKAINIFRIICTPIIMIPLLFMGYKSVTLTIVITVVNIISLIINMLYCVIKLRVRFKFKDLDLKIIKTVSAFSIWIFLNIIIDKINWNIDSLILGIYSGTVEVSVYSIGSQINMLYLTFSTAISGVLLPKTVEMEERRASDKEFTNLFIRIGKIQFKILSVILIGFIIFGKVFIKLWAGSEYVNSYYIACILMVPMTIPLIQSVGLNILQAKNKNKFRTLILLIISIFNLIISIPLAQKYGGIGSAIGTSFSMFLGQIIVNIYYQKSVGLDIKKFWKSIIFMPFKNKRAEEE